MSELVKEINASNFIGERFFMHVNIKVTGLKMVTFRFWLVCQIIKVASWICPMKSIDVFTDINDKKE